MWTKSKFPSNYPPLTGEEGYDEYRDRGIDQVVIPWAREFDYEHLGLTTA